MITNKEYHSGKLFAVEQLSDIFPEMADLSAKHYQEIAAYQDDIKLKPDMVKYKMMEETGKLLICTIRENGKLIAYTLYFIDTHIHYSGVLFGMNDILYIKPEHRKGGLAVRFLAYSELRLVERNVKVTSIHMKTYASFEKLCEFAGYDFTEKIYTKLLKE